MDTISTLRPHSPFIVHSLISPMAKRAYRKGFTLRRAPKLAMSTPTDGEHRFYAELIDSFRARRKALGMSQETLCHKLGVSHGVVQKWETGAKLPGAFFLMCWAQCLGMRFECRAND